MQVTLMMCFNHSILQLQTKIQKTLEKDSDWIIDSVIDHTISISNYDSLAARNHIKLPKDLDYLRKDLTNNQKTNDNQWFRKCLVRYLNLEYCDPEKIKKEGKDFAKRLDFKDKKCSVKTRAINKIEKKKSIGISSFGYENKLKYPIFASKNVVKIKINKVKNTIFSSKISYIHV